MVFHDETLERTTDGSGPLAGLTAAELGRLDAGARFTPDQGRSYPWRGRGVTISTFEETVESLPRGMPLIVELKTPAATELVRQAIAHHGMARRVIVAGFDPAATRPLRGAGFALGASTPEVIALVLPALLGRRVGAQAVQALCVPLRWHGIPVPIAGLARALHGSGTVTHVWTINEPAQAMALWQAGVQGIISDDAGPILAARAAAAG
jgi:glycerophosphoryl diester phosphodiesterase